MAFEWKNRKSYLFQISFVFFFFGSMLLASVSCTNVGPNRPLNEIYLFRTTCSSHTFLRPVGHLFCKVFSKSWSLAKEAVCNFRFPCWTVTRDKAKLIAVFWIFRDCCLTGLHGNARTNTCCFKIRADSPSWPPSPPRSKPFISFIFKEKCWIACCKTILQILGRRKKRCLCHRTTETFNKKNQGRDTAWTGREGRLPSPPEWQQYIVAPTTTSMIITLGDRQGQWKRRIDFFFLVSALKKENQLFSGHIFRKRAKR